jgi:hypothetical protein
LGEAWAQCLPAITLVNAAQGQEAIHLNIPARVCERPLLAKLIAQREMMCSGAAEALDIALRHQLISEQTSMVIVHERDIGNKALGVPTHSSVDQMVSGRYALSMDAPPILHAMPGRTEINHRQTAVWRLSSVREEIVPLDSDEIFGIPAFLRKQAEPISADEGYIERLPATSPVRSLKLFNDILQKVICLEDALTQWLEQAKLPLTVQLLMVNGTKTEIHCNAAALLLHLNRLLDNDQVRLTAPAVAMLRQFIEEEHGRVDIHTDAAFSDVHTSLEGVLADEWPDQRQRITP